MTNDDLDRRVAEARGWKYIEDIGWDKVGMNRPCDVILEKDWHPRKNITQAMELLEEFEEWEINKFNDFTYWVVIFNDDEIGANRNDLLAEAICRAYLKAKGKSNV